MRVVSWSSSIILLVALWLLAACAPPRGPTPIPTPTPEESDLRFETIDRSDLGYYSGAHPDEPQRIFLIRSADEIARIPSGWISRDAENAPAQLDYQRFFALALFRDRFPSSGYDVIIQRIGRRDGELIIHVQFWDPDPFRTRAAIETRPYHVVKALRDGGTLEEADLVLESQLLTPTTPAEIRWLTPGSTPEVHHSDQGVQYAADGYTELLRAANVQISMSAQGQPTENAYAERFMRTLKEEEVYLHEYQDFAAARTSIGHFLNDVYMHKRVHSALGYLPPTEFEALWRATERTTMKAASGATCAVFEAAPAAPEAIAAEPSTPVTKRIS